jgi:hypothetical protein
MENCISKVASLILLIVLTLFGSSILFYGVLFFMISYGMATEKDFYFLFLVQLFVVVIILVALLIKEAIEICCFQNGDSPLVSENVSPLLVL